MVFANLTVGENLAMGAYLQRDVERIANSREYVFTLFPRLAERIAQPAGTLSGGSNKCWRSAAPSWGTRVSSCWMSPRSASPPS